MSYNAKEHKQAKKSQKNHLRKKWLVICCIFITVIGIFGYLLLFQGDFISKLISGSNMTDTERTEYVDKISKSAKALSSTDIEAAISVYDDAINLSNDNKIKDTLSYNKSLLCFNNGNFNEALTAALLSENIKNSSDNEQYIASIYEKINDNKNAIKYYQKDIDNINKEDPLSNNDVSYYRAKITSLGNGND